MTGKDIFKIWAPAGAKWVDWVRPVPFVSIDNDLKIYDLGNFIIPKINYIEKVSLDTAVIVDLSGNEGIKEGLALAKLGFRPIPIYNGTNEQQGAIATVNNHNVEIGLIKGAVELNKMEIDKSAPPVFLLDSNRTNRFKRDVSIFDNSWDVYHQDMPSAEYFLKNHITKIIVRGQVIKRDLKKILYGLQKSGIEILFTAGYEEPKKVIIRKQVNKKND